MNHVYQLNGRNIDQTVGETEADERANATRGVHGAHLEGQKEEMEEDGKMDVEEPQQRGETDTRPLAKKKCQTRRNGQKLMMEGWHGMTMKEWLPFPEPTDFAWRTRSRL